MKRGIMILVGMDLMCYSREIVRIATQSQEIVIVQATERFDNKCFEREHMTLNGRDETPELIELYDKKGRPLELPKSKYHK